MNENRITVDYIVYEAEMSRAERHVKRWQIAFFAALAVAILGIAGMYLEHKRTLDYLAKYDFESTSYDYEYSQDGKGLNIIGDSNEVANYEPKSENTESSPQKNS